MKNDECQLDYNEKFFNTIHVQIRECIKLPIKKSLNVIFYEYVLKHKVPEFAVESFKNYFMKFIDDETHKYQRCLINEALENMRDIDVISSSLKRVYHETWSSFKPPMPQSDFEIFGNTYLKLVEHGTEGMESIARLELQFSRALSDKVAQRDLVLSNLDEKYMNSMKELESSSGLSRQADINRFEQQYHQNRLQMEINWNSDISALREEQKRDFRNFIMNASSALLLDSINDAGKGDELSSPEKLNRELVTQHSTNIVGKLKSSESSYKSKQISRSKSSSIILNKLSDFNKKLGIKQEQISNSVNKISRNSISSISFSDHLPWEESFTIHLGRQMRSTHNMRIIRVDALDLLSLSSSLNESNNNNNNNNSININTNINNGCITNSANNNNNNNINNSVLQPEIIANRLNTALSLYSRNLTGMVLLVDSRLNTYSGMKNKFAHLCEMSTDFHFPQLEHQLDEIKKILILANQKSPNKISKSSQCLEVGDVYITCHSNLNVVAVVFHLVIDESDIQKEIRFPSPIHNAIRNILRTCFLHDIYCLNLPLLLTHTVKEYMTSAWCNRRVETILKAVKGAMMELCTWRGRESRTIQFIVPTGLPEDMLSSFSSLITDYFQLSKAVKYEYEVADQVINCSGQELL